MDRFLMYVCLGGLSACLAVLSFIGYERLAWKPIRDLLMSFRRHPIFWQVVLLLCIGKSIVFGGGKTSTNEVGGVSGGTTNIVEGTGGSTNETWAGEGDWPTNEPPMLLMGLLPMPGAAGDGGTGNGEQGSGFSAEEIAAGCVLAAVGSNEVWSAEPPAGATVIGEWVLRGAFDDLAAMTNVGGVAVETTSAQQQGASGVVQRVEWAVYSQGRVVRAVATSNGVEKTEWRLLEGLTNEVMSVLPECRWGTNGPSRVWYARTDIGSVVVTWQNAMLGRDTNTPVSVQGEFYSDGNWRIRYGAECGETSRFYYRLKPEDWQEEDSDGDGLSNYDEIMRYGTSPHLWDTDGDGLGDGEEVTNGLDPKNPDQDGDGIADGCDDDPTVAMSSVDADGDGIPDQFERHWLNSTNWWNDATERDDNGFTPEAMMAAGIRPSRSVPDGSADPDGRVTSLLLWDRFAADWPTSRTNVVFERTVYIDRESNWQQFYLSADASEAKPWSLVGMRLEWEDSDGESGTATASPAGDSLYLPLSTNNPWWVKITLRATGRRVRSTEPVYLLEYAPEVSFTGGQGLELSDGSTATVFTEGSKSVIGVSIDWTGRPCLAPLSGREALLDGLANLPGESDFTWIGNASGGTLTVSGAGDLELPSFSCGELVPERNRPLLMSPNGDGEGGPHHVIVIDPSIWYGEGHHGGSDCWWDGGGYCVTYNYPLDSDCLVREWCHDDYGWDCGCSPGISSGSGSSWVSAEITGDDGTTATGSVYVDGQAVWSDSATHYTDWWWGWGGGIEYETGCCADCSDGNCDELEGMGLDSLKFRIPLGSPRKRQVSGFVYFEAANAVNLTPGLFGVMRRGDSYGSDTTQNGVRTITCSDERGRDVVIETIAHGVRLTVKTHATQALEHVWELTNRDNSAYKVHLRKISRLNNVMEDKDYECVYNSSTGRYEWQVSDGISGIVETLEREDNSYSGGNCREVRRKYGAAGQFLGSVERVRSRIGERGNAVFRETLYREVTGNNVIERQATYWEDPAHRGRNGKLKFLSATDRPWEYHAWTQDGLEVLRVEQRNGSATPGPESYEGWGTRDEAGLPPLAGMPEAFVTVYGYSALPGDSCRNEDVGRVRCETRYAVRNGTATMISRQWNRYTSGWYLWYPTLRRETWRASGPGASWNSAGNASSYTVSIDEGQYSYVPFALHGAVVETGDENGKVTYHDYEEWWDRIVDTAQEWYGGTMLPTRTVREIDWSYGKEVRRTVVLNADDSVIDDEESVYDDQNRLRSKTYLDGTTETHQYSCCRRLWSVDREGRKVLRSAVTGEDDLYWADEEVWLRSFGTGGVHRVVQHFCDGFGRETNTVVYAAGVEGEATDWTASDGRRLSTGAAEYAGTGEDAVDEADGSGKCTSTRIVQSAASEIREVTETDGAWTTLATRTTAVRNGPTTVRKSWGGKWIETEKATDYDANGCKVVTETERASDHAAFAKSVETCDFLGRVVNRTTPMGTTATVYDGSTRRIVSESRTAGGTTRTVTPLYDATGIRVGSSQDGVSRRSDTEYRESSNEWWKVERYVVAGEVTNVCEETWTQLTGIGYGLRSRVRRVDRSGVETVTTLEEGEEAGVTVETETSGVRSPVVRTKLYGLVVEERTGETVTEYEYDGLGRVVGRTTSVLRQEEDDEIVKEERFGYDACDRLVLESVYTNGAAWVTKGYAYDAFGRIVGETDAEGNAVTTAYDALDAVTAVGGAANPERYGYDSSGRRTSLKTTRNGAHWDETEWEYDAATGLCVAKEYANGSRQTMTYDGNGQLVRKTLPSGKWTQNVWDSAGRLVGVTSSDGRQNVSFVNDAFGQPVSETGSGYAYACTRADNGAVTNETLTVGSEEATVRREYDRLGRLVGREVAHMGQTARQTFEYDSENRIAAISGEVARVEYRYSATGSDLGYTLRLSDGATVSREVTVDERTGRIMAVSNRVNGVVVDWTDYTRDGDGRILCRNGDSFSHDAKGQVVTATVGEEPATYAYDAAGNFSVCTHGTNDAATAYSANALNQYTAVGGTSLATTPDGGVSSWGGWTFAYDSAERLSGVSGASGANVANFYDSKGRRIRKTASDGEHVFFWDGWNPVLEVVRGEGTTNVVECAWGKDVAGSLEAAGGVGALLWVRVDGRVYVPLYDGNGNVTAYVSEGGAVVCRFGYGAFGEETASVLQQAGDAAWLRFRYSTKYAEPETGLVYFGGRFYCPALGRWTSRDPAGEDAGANLYVFCRNAPTWLYDVLGALTWEEAYRNYLTHDLPKMDKPISEIDTSGVRADDFSSISSYLSTCVASTYSIPDSCEVTIRTSWGNAAMLGTVHLHTTGTLTIREDGGWTYSGTLTANDETLTFDGKGGSLGRRVLSWLAGKILYGGKPFPIAITGEKAFSGSGNCCGNR